MKPTLLSLEEQEVVFGWVKKFLDHLEFLNYLTGDGYYPSEYDELTYFSSRKWLMDREPQLASIIKLYEMWEERQIEKTRGSLHENARFIGDENEFNIFYHPSDIYKLFEKFDVHLQLSDSTDRFHEIGYLRTGLVLAAMLAVRFNDWAGEGEMCDAVHWRKEVKISSYSVLASSYLAITLGIGKVNNQPVPDFGIYLSDSWRGINTTYPKMIIPWPDFGVIKPSALKTVVDKVVSHLESGEVVEIACYQGHGRTGTLLASLMVKMEKLDAETAIKEVRKRHCGQSVETPEQENLVIEYYKDNR